MAKITALRLAYKQTGNVSDATCLRIVRKDGTVYRFVALDKELVMTHKNSGGSEVALPSPVTYLPASIADFSAYGSTIGEYGQVDIEGTIEALGFNRTDITNGLFDRARIYIFTTNYNRPVEDEETIMSGFWGEVTLIDGRFIAKFSSLIDTLSLTTGRIYQASCDAQLGSLRCGVPLETVPFWSASTAYTVSPDTDKRLGSIVKPSTQDGKYYVCTTAGTSDSSEPTWNDTVGATTNDGSVVWTAIYAYKFETQVILVNDIKSVRITGDFEDQYFTSGYIEVVTGNNAGLKIPIEDSDTGINLQLLFAPNQDWQVGDTIIVTTGCAKTQASCINKFLNSYNYQGFPNVPGRSAFTQGNPTY